MYLGGASEKDIEELDEGNDLYDPGVYVYISLLALTCKTLEEIFYIPPFSSVLRGGYASLTAGELPHVEGAVKPHKTYGSSGAQLLYLRHRMTRLLRGVGGDSIPEEDHHDTLGGSL
jgi:hypothetical protein